MGRLDYLACGSTSHDLAKVFRGQRRERRIFPAGAFLYRSPAATVLFDTGYAPDTAAAGLSGWLYSRVLPPHVPPGHTIDAKVRSIGVSPQDITHVVLSHAHPDHVGGVRFFPDAKFVMTSGVSATLESPRLKDGVLRALLPGWFASAPRVILAPSDFVTTHVGGLALDAHDLLGDGSYLLTQLPGHACGHLGAVVEGTVLLAGDAAWGADLIEAIPRMRKLPRLIQDDANQYRDTAEHLDRFADAGIRVCLSHDTYPQQGLL